MPRADPLSQLLLSSRPAESPVAWRTLEGADREISFGEFRSRVAALAERLADWPEGRIALYTQDSFAFAVGLFAIWHAGRVAVCPPNDQQGSLDALAELVIGAVSDGPDAELSRVPGRHWSSTEVEARADEWPTFAPLVGSDPVIELFTSGTTGRGKAIAKTLDNFALEVESLERQFGAAIGDAAIFASASHQHVYGMLFRVLWPLASGRPFHASTLLHAEELRPRLRAERPNVLASVPAHLKRLVEREGWEALGRSFQRVFSSGGPLPAETAKRWAEGTGSAPVEIFGSTETGGVASRRQDGSGDDALAWTPFPEVTLRCDEPEGRLHVSSPFVVGDLGLAMGDRARLLDDGRFLVLGRVDHVIKIGEKRLSLPDMQQRLVEHAWVRAAALLPLEQGGETRVAAVVVLTSEGAAALDGEGRRAVGVALGDALGREWDRTLLPRAWRFVEALPEDAQGKTTRAALRRLFDPEPT